nr:SOS response-associated peptidase [Jiella sonneratiae]
MTAPPPIVAECLGLSSIDDFPPRPLILPTQPILVVLAGREGRAEATHDGRAAMLVRWGLIPAWFKADERLPAMFNARAETAAENAAFRGALRYRRCLVPATAFFRKMSGEGRAGAALGFSAKGAAVFAMAGLVETYLAPDGSEIDTAAILTAEPRPGEGSPVQRLPVVIRKGDFARWLDCRHVPPEGIADLMRAPALADLAVSGEMPG